MSEIDTVQKKFSGFVDICNKNDAEEFGHVQNTWHNFSQWFHCMCVVTFDLNLGQALEYVYPAKHMPTEQEISNICYLAFPDSNSSCMGDTKFHIKLRQVCNTDYYESTADAYKTLYGSYNSDCLPLLRADAAHYWGFVYFRQRRDASLPRGYFQKSFILITRLPFFNLYFKVLDQLAQQFFAEGVQVLQQACQQIENEWPLLLSGLPLQLPLFDTVYEIQIPKSSSRKLQLNAVESVQVQAKSALNIERVQQVHELELFSSLSSILDNLYTLWELVLIAEPIVVVANSPADCSQMIQTLVALIYPLEYSAESRPFTVLPALMNEYRVPELNVQNGVLKSLSFLFEYIGEMGKDYIYAVCPLLEDALMDRDLVHRQTACAAIKHMALGVYGFGCEDALTHLLNYVWPNIFETSPHLVQAFMDAVEGLRISLGPIKILQYTLQGLFHPARKVRDVYWKIYNSLYIGGQDALIAGYPRITNDPKNQYERYELDYTL